MKKYLIVYHYADEERTGIGNANVEIDGKITIKIIRELEERLKNDYMKGKGNVVIINIIKHYKI